jgi:uncharacterized protein (DUF697 family)
MTCDPDRLRELAIDIVKKEASCAGGWSGGLFFVPWSGNLTMSIVHNRMVTRLLALYRVEGADSHLIHDIITKLRDGAGTAGITVAEGVKLVPIVGWVVGGVFSGFGAGDHTLDFGYRVIKLLQHVHRPGQTLTGGQVYDALRGLK